MSTLTITEFLEARIAEDEAMARECEESGAWSPFRSEEHLEWWVRSENFGHIVTTGYVGNNDAKPNAEHIARRDPARVLAECAAKRAILADWPDVFGVWSADEAAAASAVKELTRKRLAAAYASHADYQPEWAL